MDADWLHLQQIKMQPMIALSQLHAVTFSLTRRKGAEGKLDIKHSFCVSVCLCVCTFQENSWTGTQIRELHARMLVCVMASTSYLFCHPLFLWLHPSNLLLKCHFEAK